MFFLKSVVGLFAAIGFLIVAGIVVSALVWRQWEPLATGIRQDIPPATVLTLDLAAGIIETRPDNPLARASLGNVLVMRDVLDALEAAGRDPRVRGLMLRAGRGSLGLASAQELRDAIKDFRGQNKFSLTFAESFGEGGNRTIDYYVASSAETIWMQPSGDLALNGLMLQSPFLRGLLDKIGVSPRLGQREEYKGAMNMFTDSAQPEPQRQNLQQLADSWLGQIVAGSAEDRALTPETLRALIDQAPFGAEAAKEHGLIDRIGYLDEARTAALEAAGTDPDGGAAEFLNIADYARVQRARAEDEDGAVVALIYGLGPISLAESENDPVFGSLVMGADTVAGAIRDAVEDPDVRAIVFRIDSPGGSYVASDTIWREVRRARDEGVPVIVSMGNAAASGGYFVAAPAHAIVAQPGTVTGSIGIVAGKMVLKDLWGKIGVAWSDVKAGANADMWSPNKDFSPAAWANLQSMLDRAYDDFTGKVADGRGLPLEEVLKAAKGQVWTGEDAKALGLVDALGGLRTAKTIAAEVSGIGPGEPVRFKVFPAERDPIEALLEQVMSGELRSPALHTLARAMQVLAPLLRTIESLTGGTSGPMLRAPDLRPAS
ncbi:MAG: signal peptide peptidase SppA [Alphaproteobacteria bacterium]